jgi:hypothetical protein
MVIPSMSFALATLPQTRLHTRELRLQRQINFPLTQVTARSTCTSITRYPNLISTWPRRAEPKTAARLVIIRGKTF